MISAVVLTHNDEKTVLATLESLSWCDEVLVVDDYSTDKTAQMAKKSGALVHKRHLNDDFAAQRNFGLSKAKGEWVLFMDSDEVVPKELADEIKQLIESVIPAKAGIHDDGSPIRSGMTRYNGFYLKRKDYLFGKWLNHGETSRVRLLRLAKKEAGQWVRPVHEVWDVHGSVGELSTAIQHFPHQNVAQFLEEINRYSTLNARYLYAQKIRVSWWQVVGYPVGKFFVNYIFYLGFLDGTPGAMVAILMSFHSFLSRAKLWQLWDRAS